MAKKIVLTDEKQIEKELSLRTNKQELTSQISYFIFGFLCMMLYTLLQISLSATGFLFVGVVSLVLVLVLLHNIHRIIKSTHQIEILKSQLEVAKLEGQKKKCKKQN